MLNAYLQVAQKFLKLAFDNPCRAISHWLLNRIRIFLGASKMAAAAIFWLYFLPPQGFGPEAKTRGGIIETPA